MMDNLILTTQFIMENEWAGWLSQSISDVRYYIFYRASFAPYQNTKIWDDQVTYGKRQYLHKPYVYRHVYFKITARWLQTPHAM